MTDSRAVLPQLQPEEEVTTNLGEVRAAAVAALAAGALRLGFPLDDFLGGSAGELLDSLAAASCLVK